MRPSPLASALFATLVVAAPARSLAQPATRAGGAVPAVRLLAAGDILPAGNDWENEDDEPDQSYLNSVAPELPLQRFPGQPALLPDNDVIDATWRRLPA